jgi:hypothetical protein
MRKRYVGSLNMTNPGPIRHSETLAMYAELVDKHKQWEIIGVFEICECWESIFPLGDDHPEAERMRNSRANCALDTTKLQQMYPKLRSAREGIREAIVQVFAITIIIHLLIYRWQNCKATLIVTNCKHSVLYPLLRKRKKSIMLEHNFVLFPINV